MNMVPLAQALQAESTNTNELKVLGFNEAMAPPNKDDW